MPRKRLLSPDFFLDEDLCALPMAARILFEGLWVHADREGRLEDRPSRLKVQILPYDDVNVDELLDKLSPKFVTRYEREGRRYLQVNQFSKHQMPHMREPASTIPAPDEHQPSTGLALDRHSPSPSYPVSLPVSDPVPDPVAVAGGASLVQTNQPVAAKLPEFYAAWEKVAVAHGGAVSNGLHRQSPIERMNVEGCIGAYDMHELVAAMLAMWKSPYTPSRSIPLFVKIIDELVTHVRQRPNEMFRAPVRARDVQAAADRQAVDAWVPPSARRGA